MKRSQMMMMIEVENEQKATTVLRVAICVG